MISIYGCKHVVFLPLSIINYFYPIKVFLCFFNWYSAIFYISLVAYLLKWFTLKSAPLIFAVLLHNVYVHFLPFCFSVLFLAHIIKFALLSPTLQYIVIIWEFHSWHFITKIHGREKNINPSRAALLLWFSLNNHWWYFIPL